MEGFYTVKQLAEKSGKSARHIRRLINDGTLLGVKEGRDWFIEKEDADKWLRSIGR